MNLLQTKSYIPRNLAPAIAGVSLYAFSTALSASTAVFINEVHYDNAGTDQNEGVEIAGPEGKDLSGWKLILYNGNGGNFYGTVDLTGIIPAIQNGFGTLSFSIKGMQNGPDGVALVDSNSSVLQFLSYEEQFQATSGPAAGMMSELIGVAENGQDTDQKSLQLSGSGYLYEDFRWNGPSPQSFGEINGDQHFTRSVTTVPLPPALLLFLFGLTGMGLVGRRRPSLSLPEASA